MSKLDKLLAKARNNPEGLKFSEFESLLTLSGWQHVRTRGSHRIYKSAHGLRLPIQPDGKMAVGYQVKQFLKVYDNEN
ncbi:MAG: type II toxin-antitoxin system HicA family toxin [Gammaproteobacteria bacterium]